MKNRIIELAKKNRIFRFFVLVLVAGKLFTVNSIKFLRQHRKVAVTYAIIACLVVYCVSPFAFKMYSNAEEGGALSFFDVSGNDSTSDVSGADVDIKDEKPVLPTEQVEENIDGTVEAAEEGIIEAPVETSVISEEITSEEIADVIEKIGDDSEETAEDVEKVEEKEEEEKKEEEQKKEEKKETEDPNSEKEEDNEEIIPDDSELEEVEIKLEKVNAVSVGFEKVGTYLVGALGSKLLFGLEEDSNIAYATCIQSGLIMTAQDGEIVWEAKKECYGFYEFTFFDENDNEVAEQSLYIMVDANVPKIEVSEEDGADNEKHVHVLIYETGDVQSGLKDPAVYIDGEAVTDFSVNYDVVEENVIGQGIVSRISVDFDINTHGNHDVQIMVQDYGGNISRCKNNIIYKYTPIRVKAPVNVGLHIDPYNCAGRTSIYSDDIELRNESEYPVRVVVKKATLYIDPSLKKGIERDSLSIRLDDGKETFMYEGTNDNMMEFVLASGTSANNVVHLEIIGDVNEGTENMWKDGDIKINLLLEYFPADK